MPSSPPPGIPVPRDGHLPAAALARLDRAPLGVYVHVPFCRVRCGYCDFNTYVPQVGTAATGSASMSASAEVRSYAAQVDAELALAERVLGGAGRQVATVFVGGGTPTLLLAEDLISILDSIRRHFELLPGAEITTEANPDTFDQAYAQALAAAGFTRVSLGMQSSVSHVLATLDRTHDPVNVTRAVAAAREAGLAVSLDLIYGTPGEDLADWQASLDAAIALEPDHLSAYALVVEEGTRMGGQVARGELPRPEDDDEADKYELADARLREAGYGWYEVSNWARNDAGVCRHNLSYWRGGHWWGAGPGAHSHIGGMRWWNVRHPRSYAERLREGSAPGHEGEMLTDDQAYDEQVLLRSRLAEGLPVALLRPAGRAAVAGLIADGLVEAGPAVGSAAAIDGPWDTRGLGVPAPIGDAEWQAGSDAGADRRRVVLTVRGRLLADTVVHRLLAGDRG